MRALLERPVQTKKESFQKRRNFFSGGREKIEKKQWAEHSKRIKDFRAKGGTDKDLEIFEALAEALD